MPYGVRTFTCETCGSAITGRVPKTQRFCSLSCFSVSRKMSEIRTCHTCGKEFEFSPSPSRNEKGSGKYCSKECLYTGLRTGDHPCPNCGKVIDSQRRFCSPECGKSSYRRKRQTGRNVNCEVCGELFYMNASRLKQTTHHFCCVEHLNQWQARTKIEGVCKICGNHFLYSASHGSIYCSLKCRDKDPARSEMLREMNLKQQKLKPNSLETFAYSLLDGLCVPYERQYMIGGKFCVDAFIPSTNTVVQFDGDYWHGNPVKFPTLDKRQEKRKRIDQSQNAYFSACGYSVLRFWETDIRKRSQWVVDQIRHVIQSLDV